MKKNLLTLFSFLICFSLFGQSLSDIQKRNARATGYAVIASRNPGKNISVLMIPWDGVNTLEYNANNQINGGWHAQAAIKGKYFSQSFDGNDFSTYSSVLVSQASFDTYKHTGTQWWIACSTLPPFSESPNVNNAPIWSKNGDNIYHDEGNVGIGTANPTRQLEVGQTGQIGLRADVTQSSNAGLYWSAGELYSIHRTLGGWNGPDYEQLKLDWPTGIILDPGMGDNDGFGKSYVEIVGGKGLRVSEGTVGIGVEDPGDFKLAVNGDIKGKKVKVTPDGWADYVFDKSYKLPTLREVEVYINKNKHLPHIPAEEEVLKDGIFLGEMDAKLLQKIEELTLYTIEQEKQIVIQQESIENLKRENISLKNLSSDFNTRLEKLEQKK